MFVSLRNHIGCGGFCSFCRHLGVAVRGQPLFCAGAIVQASYLSAGGSRTDEFQENLKLRTPHENHVLSGDAAFLYFNCQPGFGLLPHFENSQV